MMRKMKPWTNVDVGLFCTVLCTVGGTQIKTVNLLLGLFSMKPVVVNPKSCSGRLPKIPRLLSSTCTRVAFLLFLSDLLAGAGFSGHKLALYHALRALKLSTTLLEGFLT